MFLFCPPPCPSCPQIVKATESADSVKDGDRNMMLALAADVQHIQSVMEELAVLENLLYTEESGMNAEQAVEPGVVDISRKAISELVRGLLYESVYRGYVIARNAGAAVFRANCSQCHGAGAAGVLCRQPRASRGCWRDCRETSSTTSREPHGSDRWTDSSLGRRAA